MLGNPKFCGDVSKNPLKVTHVRLQLQPYSQILTLYLDLTQDRNKLMRTTLGKVEEFWKMEVCCYKLLRK